MFSIRTDKNVWREIFQFMAPCRALYAYDGAAIKEFLDAKLDINVFHFHVDLGIRSRGKKNGIKNCSTSAFWKSSREEHKPWICVSLQSLWNSLCYARSFQYWVWASFSSLPPCAFCMSSLCSSSFFPIICYQLFPAAKLAKSNTLRYRTQFDRRYERSRKHLSGAFILSRWHYMSLWPGLGCQQAKLWSKDASRKDMYSFSEHMKFTSLITFLS